MPEELGRTGAIRGRARLQDVAAIAGVSIKTTSRVLNGMNASEDSKRKVFEAARFLKYRPNGLARELRTGAVSSGVGLIVGDLSNPFYSSVAASAERILGKRDLELFVASTNEEPEREERLVKTMLERRTQALLLVPAAYDHSYLQFEIALGTTIIFLDRPPVNLLADSIVGNDRASARQAALDMMAFHSRVGIIADEQVAWTAKERLAGVKDALGSQSSEYVRVGAHRAEEARRLTTELLTLPDPPSALIGLNNLITLGILMALRDTGAKCAVLGFDDSEVMKMLGVSTVLIDPEVVGRTGAERALARLDNPDLRPEAVILPMTTKIRTPLDSFIKLPQFDGYST